MLDLVAVPLKKRIEKRAYELYEQRGRQDGQALNDWLIAEAELIASITGGPEEAPNQRRGGRQDLATPD